MSKYTFIISIFLILILTISAPILAAKENKPKFEKGLSLDPQDSEGAENTHDTSHNTTTESGTPGLSIRSNNPIRIGSGIKVWIEKNKKVEFFYEDSSIPREYREAIKWFWEEARRSGPRTPALSVEGITTKANNINQLYENPEFYLDKIVEISGKQIENNNSWFLEDNTGKVQLQISDEERKQLASTSEITIIGTFKTQERPWYNLWSSNINKYIIDVETIQNR
ncbi:MAG: hypothetical protein ACOCQR_02725 [bacterium]